MSVFSLIRLAASGIGLAAVLAAAKDNPAKTADDVVRAYVRAVGGKEAVDRIHTREIEARLHHRKCVYYWQQPDKVLLVEGKARTAWDGGSGWQLSSKKRVTKLPKGAQRVLQINANPLRYVSMKQLYSELAAAPPVSLHGNKMDVLTAANDRGVTKFYFDAGTHLLARIEETGDTSAYFEHVTGFSDYEAFDGVQLPMRIVHESNEPGATTDEVRIVKVAQNLPISPGIFTKPSASATVLGGKR